jgi:hypothetical protein
MMDDTVVCQYCGRVFERGKWKGSMKRVLESHQSSRECLLVQAELLRRITEKGTHAI